jgi:6-phospho-3-hexuloisomerase
MSDGPSGGSFGALAGAICDEVRSVLTAVDEAQVVALEEAIIAAPRVFLIGEGRSGLALRFFAVRLVHLDKPVYLAGDTVTPAVRPGDVAIAASGSGETAVTCLLAEAAVKVGATLVAVTANPESRLARVAAQTVLLGTPHKRDSAAAPSIQYGGTLFEQSALILFDTVFHRLAGEAERADDSRLLRARHANLE